MTERKDSSETEPTSGLLDREAARAILGLRGAIVRAEQLIVEARRLSLRLGRLLRGRDEWQPPRKPR
jgi:hypothetical protein